MARYRIEIDCVVKVKSQKKADKLLDQMLDAIEDYLICATASAEKEDKKDA